MPCAIRSLAIWVKGTPIRPKLMIADTLLKALAQVVDLDYKLVKKDVLWMIDLYKWNTGHESIVSLLPSPSLN
jgi:hypothetical protein